MVFVENFFALFLDKMLFVYTFVPYKKTQTIKPSILRYDTDSVKARWAHSGL